MYKCPYCGAEFLKEQDYNIHVLTCKPKPKKEEKKEEPKEELKKEEKK